MKQCYPRVSVFVALLSLLFYLPTPLFSQCLCANGNTPQTLIYEQTRTIRPIDDSTNFDLLQFNPSLGQLTCASVYTYITGVVRMRLENDEIYPVNYRIAYSRTDQISGPGLTPAISNSYSKNYGPYSLAASDGNTFSGPDYIAIGPDSVLKNKYLSRNITDLTPFLGYGNVTYYYKLSGKTTVSGSVNYIFSVSSQDIVRVGVTYSYCPTGLLGTDIRDFSAVKKGKHDIQLSWTTVNESKGNQYEIEINSGNSNEFHTVGKVQSRISGGSTSTRYDFPYHLELSKNGMIYLRIRQTSASGKITYSPVRTLVFEDNEGSSGWAVYPNPAYNKLSLQFDRLLSGDYRVDIVNLAGQLVYTRMYSIENRNTIEMQLAQPPAPGVYYLRAREMSSGRVYSSKLILQRF